jgi:hypothetical protein
MRQLDLCSATAERLCLQLAHTCAALSNAAGRPRVAINELATPRNVIGETATPSRSGGVA